MRITLLTKLSRLIYKNGARYLAESSKSKMWHSEASALEGIGAVRIVNQDKI